MGGVCSGDAPPPPLVVSRERDKARAVLPRVVRERARRDGAQGRDGHEHGEDVLEVLRVYVAAVVLVVGRRCERGDGRAEHAAPRELGRVLAQHAARDDEHDGEDEVDGAIEHGVDDRERLGGHDLGQQRVQRRGQQRVREARKDDAERGRRVAEAHDGEPSAGRNHRAKAHVALPAARVHHEPARRRDDHRKDGDDARRLPRLVLRHLVRRHEPRRAEGEERVEGGRVTDDVAIVRDQAGRILTDLYTTFHGGANKFNEALLAEVKTLKSKLTQINKGEKDISWSQASAGMNFNKFKELTNDFRPSGSINTAIEFPGFQDPESLWRKVGDKGFEWMDRQITAIHRQPALNVLYTETRKNWSGIERQWVKDHVKAAIAAEPEKYSNPRAIARLEERITQDGEKRFTELGMNHAADRLLKYADNPAVRSNFAYASRTLGRYYRATEDFQRRMYRLKEVPARVLYRMRLAHLGLSASGSVFTDQQGNPYVNVPMDSTLYKATDTTLRVLTGKTGYAQPLFNDFTVKLNMINPSFQQDSGLPMLSGPIAGLGVLAMKNILGATHNAVAENTGDFVSQVALGSFGTNTNLQKVLMPQTLQRVWDMLPVNERSRQEVTAGQQAMAYNAANGIHLKSDATDQEKADYVKNIRISAHNIIFLRNFLGLISPASTT